MGSDSPPEKKPNIQDVKEYTEAHKLRKKIVAEEFNEEDDEDITEFEDKSGNETTLIGGKGADNVDHAKIISEVLKKYPHLVKNNKNIKLKITQKGQQHTITAPIRSPSGPSSSSTPKPTTSSASGPAAKPAARPQPTDKRPPPPTKLAMAKPTPPSPVITTKTVVNEAIVPTGPKKIDSRTMHALIAKGAENTTGPWLCLKCGVNGRPISIPSYKGFRRHLINVHKLKIDPKLCEHCGWRSSSKEELHHHILVVHNINPPPDMKFPKCTECKFVAIDTKDLTNHLAEKHSDRKITTTTTTTTRSNTQHCIYCNKTFNDENRLYDHMRSNHRDRAREDGVMDTDDEDLEDEEEDGYLVNLQSASSLKKDSGKIQVLSNITLPSKGVSYAIDSPAISSIVGPSSSSTTTTTQNTCKLEPSSEAEGLNNVATGIATSLGMLDTEHLDEEAMSSQDESNISAYLEDEMASVHGEKGKEVAEEEQPMDEGGETQFVTEEGATLELTEPQKAELLEQLQDKQGVVMVLSEDAFGEEQPETKKKKSSDSEGTNKSKAEKHSAKEATTVEKTLEEASIELVFDIEPGNKVEEESKEDENTEAETSAQDEDAEPSTSENVETTTETVPAASSAKADIEGDWTDDDDEEEEAEAEEKAARPETPSPLYESNVSEETSPDVIKMPSARSYKGREGRSSNDSIKEAVVSQDSGIEEKQPTQATDGGESETALPSEVTEDEQQQQEEEEEEFNIDVPKTDEEELKKASKIEIKTLINDWGDDDDDENLD